MKGKKPKVILVTGASSGMGKEIALHLLNEGHIVYGGARRMEKMQDINEAGGVALELDVTNARSIKDTVTQIIKEQGKIDVLVNNAGYALYGAVEDTHLEDARQQFEVNLFGLAAVTKEILPYMREQNYGKIINISSMGGKIYTPLGAWYHATKHALEGWSDCLRLEVKQFGIDVIIIEPGIIATEFGDVLYQPLLERSGKGPYSKMANSVAKASKISYEKKNASPASVIAVKIAKAIRVNSPRTRYVGGKMAKPLILIRKWFGDKVFDKAVMSQI